MKRALRQSTIDFMRSHFVVTISTIVEDHSDTLYRKNIIQKVLVGIVMVDCLPRLV